MGLLCLFLSLDVSSIPMTDIFNGTGRLITPPANEYVSAPLSSFARVAPAPLKAYVVGTDEMSRGKHKQYRSRPNSQMCIRDSSVLYVGVPLYFLCVTISMKWYCHLIFCGLCFLIVSKLVCSKDSVCNLSWENQSRSMSPKSTSTAV